MDDPIQKSEYSASADLVIEMEEAGIGVEEILQYANAVLTPEEIEVLRRGLKKIARKDTAAAAATAAWEEQDEDDFSGQENLEETLALAGAG